MYLSRNPEKIICHEIADRAIVTGSYSTNFYRKYAQTAFNYDMFGVQTTNMFDTLKRFVGYDVEIKYRTVFNAVGTMQAVVIDVNDLENEVELMATNCESCRTIAITEVFSVKRIYGYGKEYGTLSEILEYAKEIDTIRS